MILLTILIESQHTRHALSSETDLSPDKIKSQLFGILNFGHCVLPFDLAQGGEPVEPFGICVLLFEIY